MCVLPEHKPCMPFEGADPVSRRRFLSIAAMMGASLAWAQPQSESSRVKLTERRDLFPEGVASGDPDSTSVVLWTRRAFTDRSQAKLRVEVSADEDFHRIVATAGTSVSAAEDWTCRVLVANLKPAHVYWYRFIDESHNASRVGRTLTAPANEDTRPVKFAFVSCQNVNYGAQNAYRRMIFEDERAPEADRLGFVLHLGDFIYEAIWYPEDRPQGMYGRPLREVVRYPHGEKISDFHVPVSLEDYRAVYRAYLHDTELQDARARWPFVCMWDNHEFSWYGWQSVITFNGTHRPGQTRKVAANQAWFEYQPTRIARQFTAPQVRDAPIARFDDHGFGDESNNRAAVASLTGYRALRWGRHVDLIVTDQRSYRSEDPTNRAEAKGLMSEAFPELFPQEALEILDAGRSYAKGKPPQTLRFGAKEIPNFRQGEPPQTVLGAEQKTWFLQRLRESTATWKIWGNTLGTLDFRIDPQNLPRGLTQPWPGAGYAGFRVGDHSTAYTERAEIYSAVRDAKIRGFAIVSGDRHSFWAGLAAPALPPLPFEPVGVAFVTGSISAPGILEKMEQSFPKDHPLSALYVARRSKDARPEPAINMLLRHGVRSCLEYQSSGDVQRARSLSNPQLSPHLSFLDLGGHGYSTVRASSEALECEFVCIARPIERSTARDGGPLLYRIVHRAPLAGTPRLEHRVLEGNPALSL